MFHARVKASFLSTVRIAGHPGSDSLYRLLGLSPLLPQAMRAASLQLTSARVPAAGMCPAASSSFILQGHLPSGPVPSKKVSSTPLLTQPFLPVCPPGPCLLSVSFLQNESAGGQGLLSPALHYPRCQELLLPGKQGTHRVFEEMNEYKSTLPLLVNSSTFLPSFFPWPPPSPLFPGSSRVHQSCGGLPLFLRCSLGLCDMMPPDSMKLAFNALPVSPEIEK